jgi:hypothetical protein
MPAGEVGRSSPQRRLPARRCSSSAAAGASVVTGRRDGPRVARARTSYPPAAARHPGVSRLRPWLHERWLAACSSLGTVARAGIGSPPRLHMCVAPLIPFALLARTVPAVRVVARQYACRRNWVPTDGSSDGARRGRDGRTAPALAAAERQLTSEVHRLAYLAGGGP